jgi:hypothetical protein
MHGIIDNRQNKLFAPTIVKNRVTSLSIILITCTRTTSAHPSCFIPKSLSSVNFIFTMLIDDNPLIAVIVSIVALILGSLYLLLSKKKKVLPLLEFKPFPLIRKKVLSHDTACFTFGLPTPETILGLPTGQHISLRYFETDKESGDKKQVMRSYTPVSDNSTLGEVSLVIKIYKAGVHPKFPDGGKLSQHLDSLQIGDTVDIKGPKGHMEYLGNGGNFWMKPIGKPKTTKQCKQFIMIAGKFYIYIYTSILLYMCCFVVVRSYHN